jgi:hypothetical protein
MKAQATTMTGMMIAAILAAAPACTLGATREHVQDRICSVIETSDGSTLVLAEKGYVDTPVLCDENCGDAVSFLWVLKLDAGGGVVWEKTFKVTDRNEVAAGGIVEIRKDRYVIAAWSSAHGDRMWLLALDGEGNKVWERTDRNPLQFYSPLLMRKSGDDEALVAGIGAAGDGSLDENVYAMTVNAEGDITGRFSSDLVSEEGFYNPACIEATADGGFVVLAERDIENPGTANGYPHLYYSDLVKVTAEGRIAWRRTFAHDDLGENRPAGVRETPTGYVVALNTTDPAWYETMILFLDGEGGTLSSKTLGDLRGNTLGASGAGSIVVAGARGGYPFSGTTSHLTVVVMGGDGNTTWESSIDAAPDFFTADAAATGDGSYLFGDMTSARIVKLDGSGAVEWLNEYRNP